MSDRIIAKVYQTKNYSKFKPFRGNRGQTPRHVEHLEKSIDAHGWINSMPMSVKKGSNGTLEILDGHNRFYAAKALKQPVKYTMVNGEVGDQDVCLLNRTQKRWTMGDFVRSFANLGNKEYQVILNFMEQHRVGVRVAASFLSMRAEASGAFIETGRFVVEDLVWADQHVTYLKQMNAVVPWSLYKSKFVRSFINACKLEGFDPPRFVKQVLKRPQMVVDYGTQQDIYLMFEEVYNYGYATKNKMPLAFAMKTTRSSSK